MESLSICPAYEISDSLLPPVLRAKGGLPGLSPSVAVSVTARPEGAE